MASDVCSYENGINVNDYLTSGACFAVVAVCWVGLTEPLSVSLIHWLRVHALRNSPSDGPHSHDTLF